MEQPSIEILLNGRPETVAAGTTIAGLIHRLELIQTGIAVAVNDEVARRESFDTRRLSPGDKVEIIHAVGGG